ncbi:MAG: cupin domain-containing protein [bacterium]|nr:cupin domain-containing protein [bacterium]
MKEPQHLNGAHVALAKALTKRPSANNLAAEIMRHDGLDLEFYSPHLVDLQQPHERDELYVIARGTGVLDVEGEQFPFVEGDVLFVPALAEHRFTNFSHDFGTWVMFFGSPHEAA